MAFNVEQHANLGYIDRDVKDKLDKLCVVHKRTLKAELEWIISQAYSYEANPPITINK